MDSLKRNQHKRGGPHCGTAHWTETRDLLGSILVLSRLSEAQQRVIRLPPRLHGCRPVSNANYFSEFADASSLSCTVHRTNGTICLAARRRRGRRLRPEQCTFALVLASLAQLVHTDGQAAASQSVWHSAELLWKLLDFQQCYSHAVSECFNAVVGHTSVHCNEYLHLHLWYWTSHEMHRQTDSGAINLSMKHIVNLGQFAISRDGPPSWSWPCIDLLWSLLMTRPSLRLTNIFSLSHRKGCKGTGKMQWQLAKFQSVFPPQPMMGSNIVQILCCCT